MKTAILQMADAGPVESTAAMLYTVGYDVFLPNAKLRNLLTSIGCDTVLSPRDLTKDMGYDPISFPEVGPESMDGCDLYCDIKAHRCYDKVVSRWPRLAGRILWSRINGGSPEHVINARGDHGDEVNPPCPVLTPNLWYRDKVIDTTTDANKEWKTAKPAPWADKAYAMWPPFVRFDEYTKRKRGLFGGAMLDPVCLIHGIAGWGYGALIDNMRAMGVRCYGANSPDGLIQHRDIPLLLSTSRAMVHLKSSDAPGYSLYEALASACPIICTRRLIWRNRMQDMFEPGVTCLVFDRETHNGLTDADVSECTREVKEHLERLADPVENKRIGDAGRKRLRELMWSADNAADVASLRAFMERNFP